MIFYLVSINPKPQEWEVSAFFVPLTMKKPENETIVLKKKQSFQNDCFLEWKKIDFENKTTFAYLNEKY